MSLRPLAFAPLFLAACAPPSAAVAPSYASPSYRAVHLDVLAPSMAGDFEAARRDFVAALHAAHASDHRGYYFAMVDDGALFGFLSMRSFTRFSEIDAWKEAQASALSAMPKETLESYDARSDRALVSPHRSEIWRLDDDASYAPSGGAVDELHAASGRIVFEERRPDTASEEACDAAWEEEKKALVAAKYPLTKVAFRSSYGSGRLVAMWLAPSKDALANAPSVDAAVASIVGAERGKALHDAIEANVLRREAHALVPRPDLSSP